MVISAKKILQLNRKYRLVENLSEREMKNPEGIGIDVRAGEVYSLKGNAHLGVETRESPETNLIAISGKDKEVILKPMDYVLVKTMERLNLPAEKITVNGKRMHIMVDAKPRSTLQRCGVYLMSTKTDPGYSGELTFALVNLGPSQFRLELGARIANLVFHEVIGNLHRAYSGQWKGGRVSTKGVEKQI
ncbi:deoxycytidine triphosphate deaminase [mine drainage metagenome]|uniref:Deoxycytidine triphosphate deaminase n=1 Tax=mine drainage metagenome TaxID=410659 RepID=T1BQ80_9ZZZZ